MTTRYNNASQRRNPQKKMFLLENVIFQGLKLSLGHFGQEVPESPMSQLQKGVSTSSLPPFNVDVLIFKVYPRFFIRCFTSGLQWAETAVL